MTGQYRLFGVQRSSYKQDIIVWSAIIGLIILLIIILTVDFRLAMVEEEEETTTTKEP